MAPPKDEIQALIEQWNYKAGEDLGLARHLLAEQSPFFTAIGFHAQQAAEKYLKAYLVAMEVSVPKTHSIEFLVRLAASDRPELGNVLSECIVLSDYSVDVRYPADIPDLTFAEAAQAVALAELVHAEITAALRERGFSA